ncbi:hypothetical protein Dimus_032652 [Dionaea muscipula]
MCRKQCVKADVQIYICVNKLHMYVKSETFACEFRPGKGAEHLAFYTVTLRRASSCPADSSPQLDLKHRENRQKVRGTVSPLSECLEPHALEIWSLERERVCVIENEAMFTSSTVRPYLTLTIEFITKATATPYGVCYKSNCNCTL